MSPRPSASPGPWFFPWWIELVSPLFASRSTSTRLLLAGLCGLALLAPGDAVRAELRGHGGFVTGIAVTPQGRSEEHTSELQSLMRISYAVICLKQKKNIHQNCSDKKTNN